MLKYTATCIHCNEIVPCAMELDEDTCEQILIVEKHDCSGGIRPEGNIQLRYEGSYIEVPKEELGLGPEKPTGLHDDSINAWWDSNRSD